MASSTNGVVVWEFDENGRWIPYDPQVATDIEHHYAKLFSNQTGSGGGILAVNGNQRPPALQAAGASAKPKSVLLDLQPSGPILGNYYVDLSTMEQKQKTPGACQYLHVEFAFKFGFA